MTLITLLTYIHTYDNPDNPDNAGAKPDALNNWKLSPLAVSLQKGRYACAAALLALPNVDINFRDSSGRTHTTFSLFLSLFLFIAKL